jgi:hypothetical protein
MTKYKKTLDWLNAISYALDVDNDCLNHDAEYLVDIITRLYEDVIDNTVDLEHFAEAKYFAVNADGKGAFYKEKPIVSASSWTGTQIGFSIKNIPIPLGLDWRLCIWHKNDHPSYIESNG